MKLVSKISWDDAFLIVGVFSVVMAIAWNDIRLWFGVGGAAIVILTLLYAWIARGHEVDLTDEDD